MWAQIGGWAIWCVWLRFACFLDGLMVGKEKNRFLRGGESGFMSVGGWGVREI